MAGEIDEGAAGFLEYQTGLSSRMGEKVGGSSMRAVQCKLGLCGSFTHLEREKHEWGCEGHEWEGEGMWQVNSAESWNERARNLRAA